MSIATDLQRLKESLKASDRLPVVFLGHGSPMNAIEDNAYARSWEALGHALPHPQAILVVSAHWMTKGSTLVAVNAKPETIHDFYGFPRELFAVQYPAPGAPEMAQEVVSLLASHHAQGDDTWGLDHGAWSVLRSLYPGADVPVFQLSVDMTAPLSEHIAIGAALKDLRHRGVLILGSGNIVHNLRAMRYGARPYDWAEEFDALVAQKLEERDFAALADRESLGKLLTMAHPSIDHYLPALTVAGASDEKDKLIFMNSSIDIASVSMRSFIWY